MTDIVVAAAIFGLVLALWLLVVGIVSRRRAAKSARLQHRIGLPEYAPGQTRVLRLWHEGREAITMVPGERRKLKFLRALEAFAHESNWGVPARTLLIGLAGLVSMVFVATLAMSQSLLLSPLMAAATVVLAFTYVKQYLSRRTARFEGQFVDALELAARSLRAGHPLLGAFRLVSEEMSPPVSTVFAGICQQQAMGRSLEEALRRAAAESTSPDMKLFATSVAIQLRSGGNLADMMDRLAFVMRDRIRLSRRVRVLTAQTQFSKRILLAMPFLLFILLNVISAEYMRELYTTGAGRIMVAGAGAGLLAGAWLMNRMAVIRW